MTHNSERWKQEVLPIWNMVDDAHKLSRKLFFDEIKKSKPAAQCSVCSGFLRLNEWDPSRTKCRPCLRDARHAQQMTATDYKELAPHYCAFAKKNHPFDPNWKSKFTLQKLTLLRVDLTFKLDSQDNYSAQFWLNRERVAAEISDS